MLGKVWSYTVKQWQHDDPSFEPHQCLLAGTWKRIAQLPNQEVQGVAPEVNLNEHVTYKPLPSANMSPEVQNRGVSGPTKGLVSSNFFKKKYKPEYATAMSPKKGLMKHTNTDNHR